MIYYSLTTWKSSETKPEKPYIALYDFDEVDAFHTLLDEKVVKEIFNQDSIRYEAHQQFDVLCVWKTLIIEKDKQNTVFIFVSKDTISFVGQKAELTQFVLQLSDRIHSDQASVGLVLHHYLLHLASNYYKITNVIETKITQLEDEILEETGDEKVYSRRILQFRKTLLLHKRRLEQYLDIIDYLLDNNNDIYDLHVLSRFSILKDRYARMYSQINSLLEYVTEVREAYQSEMDNKQNKIMSLFTVITSIFLPLTLIVGWYGMNLPMPEYETTVSYPIVIVISIVVVIFCLLYFKRKKWF